MSVSATEPDWSREAVQAWWDPSRKLLRSIRRYQAARGPFSGLVRRYWALQHRFWSVVTQAEIHLNSQIAGGLMIPHPNGIVIHPATKIGPNCMILQQVTFGTRHGSEAPVIGGHVDVGAGAKILGDVTVGDHAVIGANAVVLEDVPEGATAVGIPARVVTRAPAAQGIAAK